MGSMINALRIMGFTRRQFIEAMSDEELSEWARFRERRYANENGYFWLPCPLCGKCFGGHERPMGTLMTPLREGHSTCANCRVGANLLNTASLERRKREDLLARQWFCVDVYCGMPERPRKLSVEELRKLWRGLLERSGANNE